jgi:hypothetical protein
MDRKKMKKILRKDLTERKGIGNLPKINRFLIRGEALFTMQ